MLENITQVLTCSSVGWHTPEIRGPWVGVLHNAKINEFLSTFKINLFTMIPDGKKKTKKLGYFQKVKLTPLKQNAHMSGLLISILCIIVSTPPTTLRSSLEVLMR
jgi:hypothetical protein